MNIINKTIITSLAILLGACASPKIHKVDDYTLQIEFDDNKAITGYGKIIYKSRVNLTNINIYQNVYKLDSGLILTYEDASISTGYQFNYGVNKMVGIIFNDYNAKIISNKGNFYFIELQNYNETLYLILDNMNKKRYKLVYGFDKDTFYNIYDQVINDVQALVNSDTTNKKSIKTKEPQLYINSSWNQRNIILDVILTKIGGRVVL